MVEVELDGKFYEEFLACKARLPRLMGGTYIQELWNAAGKPIHVTQLYCLYNCTSKVPIDESEPNICIPGLDMIFYNEPEMPLIDNDSSSIEHYKRWMKALLEQLEEAKQFHDPARIDDLQDKLDYAANYLAKHLSKQHHLIEEISLSRRHRDIIRHSISRFLKSIEATNPELCLYLKQHLQIRKYCFWKVE